MVSKENSKKVIEMVEELMKDEEFKGVKMTSDSKNEQVKLKFYGALFVVERIGQKVDEFEAELREKSIHYRHIVKEKFAEMMRSEAVVDKIEKKYGITLTTNITHISCKITVSDPEDASFL